MKNLNERDLSTEPPSKKGELLSFESAFLNLVRTWKDIYAMIQGDILCLYENEESSKWGQIQKTIPLVESNIVETIVNSSRKQHTFMIEHYDSKFIFACKDADEAKEWVEICTLVRNYWIRKEKARLMKQTRLYKQRESEEHMVYVNTNGCPESDCTTVRIWLAEGDQMHFLLRKTITVGELMAFYNKNIAASSHGPLVMHVVTAPVDNDMASYIKPKVYSLAEEDLVFRENVLHYYLASEQYEVTVIYFSDLTYVTFLAKTDITTSQIIKELVVQERILVRGTENVGLFYHLKFQLEPCADDDQPLTYKESVKGAEFYLMNKQLGRSGTLNLTPEERHKLNQAKERAITLNNDQIQKQITDALNKKLSQSHSFEPQPPSEHSGLVRSSLVVKEKKEKETNNQVTEVLSATPPGVYYSNCKIKEESESVTQFSKHNLKVTENDEKDSENVLDQPILDSEKDEEPINFASSYIEQTDQGYDTSDYASNEDFSRDLVAANTSQEIYGSGFTATQSYENLQHRFDDQSNGNKTPKERSLYKMSSVPHLVFQKIRYDKRRSRSLNNYDLTEDLMNAYFTNDTEKLPPPTNNTEKLPPPTSDTEKLPPPTNVTEKLPPPTNDTEKLPPPTNDTENLSPPTNDTEKLPPPTNDTEKLPMQEVDINIVEAKDEVDHDTIAYAGYNYPTSAVAAETISIDEDFQTVTESLVLASFKTDCSHNDKKKRTEVQSKEKALVGSQANRTRFVCKKCEDLSENPYAVNIPHKLEAIINNTREVTYMCLSGVHLRLIDDNWTCVDDTTLKQVCEPPSSPIVYKLPGNVTCAWKTATRHTVAQWHVFCVCDVTQKQCEKATFADDHCHSSLPTISSVVKEKSDECIVKVSSFDSETVDSAFAHRNKTMVQNQQATALFPFKGFGGHMKKFSDGAAKKMQEIKGMAADAFHIPDQTPNTTQIIKIIDSLCEITTDNTSGRQNGELIDLLVRVDLSRALAEFLSVGLNNKRSMQSLFHRKESPTVLSVVKKVACQDARIGYVTRNTDDFPSFICALLNANCGRTPANFKSNDCGQNNLLVVFFELILTSREILTPFYTPTSYMNIVESAPFVRACQQIMLNAARLNGVTFRLNKQPTKRPAAASFGQNLSHADLFMLE